MATVLVGEVGPAVADPVALRERAVEQDVIGIGPRRTRRSPGARWARWSMTAVA
ncbi:hypothetical protein ACIBK8_32695 [Streptomyces sp. NPDC050161]|uniref:hypothetical protein n=1 Tax=Streptomyces sp. NPDC050161 TaxID=3365604 RepID=UPI0037A5F527